MAEEINVIDVYKKVVEMLNKTEDYLDKTSDRQSYADLKKEDILHFIEEIDYYFLEHYNEKQELTPQQCKNIVYLLMDILKERRKYKKEQSLYDIIRTNNSKLGYQTQRQSLLGNLCQREKSLKTLYRPRVLGYDEIWNEITTNKTGRKPQNIFTDIEYTHVKNKEGENEDENKDI